MAIKDSLAAVADDYKLPNGEEEFGNNNNNGNSYPCKFPLEDSVDDEAGSEPQSSMARNLYWESQEALLQEILENYKLSGTKVREGINNIIERVITTSYCECPPPKLESCAKCLRSRAVNELCNDGFTATLCTSKWNQTEKRLGGRHEYVEVIVSTQGRKNKQVPLVIELNFRDEFKMAKACEEYCRMVEQLLPEIYIGKAEYLNAIVRVVCDAAKKSSLEQRIHMGPWRKTSFMLMKWSAPSIEKISLDDQSSSSQVLIMSPRQWHASIVSRAQPLVGATVEVA